MGNWGHVARLTAVVCTFCFLAKGEVTPAPARDLGPITKRSQLSPLAKALDDMLFGDLSRLSHRDANPFVGLRMDTEGLASALEEVKAWRGEAYTELQNKGSEVNDKYTWEIQTAARDLLTVEKRRVNPRRPVVDSFISLVAQAESGERKLTLAELHQSALNQTRVQVPGAFAGGRGLEDPIAAETYNKNSFRADIFETKPKNGMVSQTEFEDWRREQMQFLAQQHYDNQLRILQSHLEGGSWRIFLETPADNHEGQTTYRRIPLTWSLLKKFVAPMPLQSKVTSRGIAYRYPTEIPLRLPPMTALTDSWGSAITLSAEPRHVHNGGKLDVNYAAEVHLTRLLAQVNHSVIEAMSELSGFTYAAYRQDRGKRFVKEWDKGIKSDLDMLTKQHKVPSMAASVKAFKEAPPGLEIAVWGRFAEASDIWQKASEYKGGFWRDLFGGPGSLYSRSAERPIPLKVRATDAAHAAGKIAKRWLPIPLVIAGAIGAAYQLDALPSLSFPQALNAVATHADSADNEMPQGQSRIGSAFNKPLSSLGDTPLFRIDARAEDGKIPLRFGFGDPHQANRLVSVPSALDQAEFVLRSAKVHRGTAEIPTGDGTTLSAIEVVGEDGRKWRADRDYHLRQTPAGETVVFPLNSEPYQVQAGFVGGGPLTRPPLVNPELQSLSHDALGELSTELRGHGFRYLPQLMTEMIAFSKNKDLPITVYDFEQILKESAYYSQVKENEGAQLFASEIAQAARFLNPEGISCYQCDGARELGVGVFRRLLSKQSGVTVTPRNVLVREPGSNVLSTAGGHADFVMDDAKSGHRYILDTTPAHRDPRDKTPYPTTGGAAPTYSDTGSELSDTVTEKVAAKSARPEPAAPARPTVPLRPWSPMLLEFFARIGEAAPVRGVTRERTSQAVAAGGPNPPSSAGDGGTKLPPKPPAVVSLEPPGHWEMDPNLERLETKRLAVIGEIARLKLFPANNGRLPTTVMMELTKEAQKFLRGEMTYEEFRKFAELSTPAKFRWPATVHRGRIVGEVMKAVWERQKELVGHLRESWKHGKTKSYAGLLDPKLNAAIQGLVDLASKTPIEPPRWVHDTPAPLTCTAQLIDIK